MLGVFVAGSYAGTYNGAALGLTQEGYHLSWQFHKDVVNQTDGYGRTTIESFYLGADVYIGGVFKEWKAAVAASVSPYNSWVVAGATEFGLGTISVADTAMAKALVLSAAAGTPAASAPASLTASLAIIDQGFNVDQLYGPTHRMTPFRYQLYPYVASTVKFFTAT